MLLLLLYMLNSPLLHNAKQAKSYEVQVASKVTGDSSPSTGCWLSVCDVRLNWGEWERCPDLFFTPHCAVFCSLCLLCLQTRSLWRQSCLLICRVNKLKL